ncbi:unnamed protein product [Closterium sp. Naga37s-1]|nr:unnamed protein product [Closterium sp. Naga37s-1]
MPLRSSHASPSIPCLSVHPMPLRSSHASPFIPCLSVHPMPLRSSHASPSQPGAPPEPGSSACATSQGCLPHPHSTQPHTHHCAAPATNKQRCHSIGRGGTWGVEGVAFCGRVEEAKLLALEGQQDMAVRLLQHLLRPDLPPHASQGSASPSAASAAVTTAAVTTVAAACVPVSDRIYTLGLAAKWLGETRSISSRVVLNDYLWRAVDLTTHPPTASHSASPSAAAAAATAPPSYASLPFANNWHQQKQERQWKQQQQQQGGYGGQQGGEREQGGQEGEQGQWQQRRQWGEVHFQMARYVDGLFVVLHTRLHSQQWRAAQDLTTHKTHGTGSAHKTHGTGSAHKTHGTGSAHKTHGTGNAHKTHGTGSAHKTHGTGSAHKTHGTGSAHKTHGTGSAHKTHGTGSAHKTHGTGSAHKTHGTGSAHKTHGTGSAHKTHGTGSAHKTHGTGSAHKTHGTGSAHKTHGTGSAHKTHGTGSAHKTHGTGSAHKTHGTGSAHKTHGTGSAHKTHGTGSAHKTHGTGSAHKTHGTGSAHKTHGTGSAHKTHGTGSAHKTHGTGSAHKTHGTGSAHKTHGTGSAHKTHGTGSAHKTHGTGSAHKTHGTGSAHKTHGTGSAHKTHGTGSAHKTHGTGSAHKTHGTGSAHKTHGTGSAHKTHGTGSAHKTHGTGSAHKTHGTGSAHKTHGTGSAHKTHGTGSAHKTHGTGSAHKTHGTGSAHKTHGTGSAHKTHGTGSAHKTHGTGSAHKTHGTGSAHKTHGTGSAHKTHGTGSAHKTHGTGSAHKTHGNGKCTQDCTAREEDERRVYGMKMMELQKQLSMDDQEANDLQGEHDMYLRAALENYRNCLLAADTFNIKGVTVEVVFRLTALWFTLLNDATADAVNAEMLTTIQTVPSYKFLPLVYQMASRMSERDPHGSPPLHPETPDFQSVLTTLVKRMADDHPLHTLPVLMALANGNRVRSSQRGRNLFVVDEDKIRAAKAVLGGMAERHKPMLDEDCVVQLLHAATGEEKSQAHHSSFILLPAHPRPTCLSASQTAPSIFPQNSPADGYVDMECRPHSSCGVPPHLPNAPSSLNPLACQPNPPFLCMSPQMQQLMDLYIRLAEMESSKEVGSHAFKAATEKLPQRQGPLAGAGAHSLGACGVLRLLKNHLLLSSPHAREAPSPPAACPQVPVLTASVPVDRTCCYAPGSFPAFCGLKDSMR